MSLISVRVKAIRRTRERFREKHFIKWEFVDNYEELCASFDEEIE